MIYRNVLGIPESRASISVSRGLLRMHAVSDAPERKWELSTPIESIVSEMEAMGWKCVCRKDGFGKPVIDCVHCETQAVIDEFAKAQDEKFASAEQGYIRFGGLPASGASVNHRAHTMEAGVSCFNAEIASDGSYRLLLTSVLRVTYFNVCQRQAYRLYGDRVGTGADGEPLIKVAKCVKI